MVVGSKFEWCGFERGLGLTEDQKMLSRGIWLMWSRLELLIGKSAMIGLLGPVDPTMCLEIQSPFPQRLPSALEWRLCRIAQLLPFVPVERGQARLQVLQYPPFVHLPRLLFPRSQSL